MLIRPATKQYRTWTTDSRRWAHYAPRRGDVVIATAPKCGTTWVQRIVALLVFQDCAPRPIPVVSPWIDRRFAEAVEETYQRLDRQDHRRFMKSHLPIDGLPLFDEVFYIHVARDGRDALMSMHNHFTGYSAANLEALDRVGLEDDVLARAYPRLPTDPAEFFRQWLTTPVIPGQSEGTPTPSYFDLEVGYWSERHRENMLLVHYNDLKSDLGGEMRRIASFLNITVDEAMWPDLTAAATFENMRAAGGELMPMLSHTLRDGPQRFFHSGQNGRWREALTDQDIALYEAKVREKFTPGLSSWLEFGRLATTDPKLASD